MTGMRVALGIHSDTLGAVARQFVNSRDASRRCPAWRSRQKGNLGWVPLIAARAFQIDQDHGAVVLLGRFIAFGFPAHSTARSRPPHSARMHTAVGISMSVLDAGWSSFREMLRYKALRHGVSFAVVNEAFSTQVCSECASIGGPKVSQTSVGLF
jgi:hypothetical protein